MASCSTAEVSCAPPCSHRVSLCGGVVYKWWFLAQFPFPPSKSKKNAQKYHAQMRDYEHALLSLGYSSVKKLLLYIQEQEVEILN